MLEGRRSEHDDDHEDDGDDHEVGGDHEDGGDDHDYDDVGRDQMIIMRRRMRAYWHIPTRQNPTMGFC